MRFVLLESRPSALRASAGVVEGINFLGIIDAEFILGRGRRQSRLWFFIDDDFLVVDDVHSFPLDQFLLQKYLVAQPVYFCFVALALELVLLALDGLEVHGHHLPILLRKLQHLRREQSL